MIKAFYRLVFVFQLAFHFDHRFALFFMLLPGNVSATKDDNNLPGWDPPKNTCIGKSSIQNSFHGSKALRHAVDQLLNGDDDATSKENTLCFRV